MSFMSTRALGGYLEMLIKEQDLTVVAVTDAAGVNQNYIWRLMNGKTKRPGVQTIVDLVRAARGSIEKAIDLLADEGGTVESGREAAREWLKLTEADRERLKQIVQTRDPEELQLFIVDLRRAIAHDPLVLSRLRAYMDGLLSR